MQRQSKTVKGLEGLMDTHMKALQENSDALVAMLEALSKKRLKEKDLRELKSIKKELNRINNELEDIAFAGDGGVGDLSVLDGFI